jgi:P2-related tail formation protein
VLRLLKLYGEVKEWFEYGGEPHHFKLTISVNRTLQNSNVVLTRELEEKLLELVSEYKNVRSWLEEFRVQAGIDTGFAVAGGIKAVGVIRAGAV